MAIVGCAGCRPWAGALLQPDRVRQSLGSVTWQFGFSSGRLEWQQRQNLKRWYSTATESKTPEAFISTSSDPYFNLSLEDFLFRSRRGGGPLLLLYRNKTCVVLGRNQNPWKEVNAAAMRERGIPLVRRRSGGGTVYHDEGNTNYSIHVSRDDFDRTTNAQLIARALNNPPIHLASHSAPWSPGNPGGKGTGRIASSRGVYVNERNDICAELISSGEAKGATDKGDETRDRKARERKVSGSAYKLIANRAYHHGTMLLSSDLSSLGSALRNERGDQLSTKGIASVRAQVVNLREAFPERIQWLNHDTFCQAVVTEFWKTHGHPDHGDEAQLVGEDMLQKEPKLKQGYEELTSWEWTYGQTPEFTHKLKSPSPAHQNEQHNAETSSAMQRVAQLGRFEVEITSRQGLILSCAVSNLDARDASYSELLKRFFETMQGQRYDDYAMRPPGVLHGAHEEGLMLGRHVQLAGSANESNIERDLLTWLKWAL